MKNKFSKNDLIFYFQTHDFPKSLIAQDTLIHQDLIFSDESEEPELNQSKKKIKYSNCFILEDELESKSKGGFKKGNGIGKGPFNSSNSQNKQPYRPKEVVVWRKNEQEENTGGFFDNFKGKTDEKQVEKFKRNLEVSFSRENSISIQHSVLHDHLSKASETEGGQEHSSIKYYEAETASATATLTATESLSADNFFENADKIMGTKNEIIPDKETIQSLSKLTHILNKTDPNPKIVNIEVLFKINELLQYPKEENLWYIFHPVAKSAFGPLSSPNIKEMYESIMLDGQSEIRFIDIYSIKNKKPFSFFTLKEIENSSFIDDIEISPLLKVAVSIKSKQTEEVAINTNKNTSKETLQCDITDKKPIDVKLDSDSIYNMANLSSKEKKKIAANEKKKPVVVVVEKKDQVIIQEQIIFDITAKPYTAKKIQKVPKGKPVELEVELGFKTEDSFVDAKSHKPKQSLAKQPVFVPKVLSAVHSGHPGHSGQSGLNATTNPQQTTSHTWAVNTNNRNPNYNNNSNNYYNQENYNDEQYEEGNYEDNNNGNFYYGGQDYYNNGRNNYYKN